MFISRLLNQGNAPILEQTLEFTAARHRLLVENLANISTPGNVQKDLDVKQFQAMLRQRVEMRAHAPIGSIGFNDIQGESYFPTRNVVFHDRNNRSVEQLAADVAKNGMLHNMTVELLRKSFSSIETALRERIS
jgi:flagellar basal-body rod protein FlgB